MVREGSDAYQRKRVSVAEDIGAGVLTVGADGWRGRAGPARSTPWPRQAPRATAFLRAFLSFLPVSVGTGQPKSKLI